MCLWQRERGARHDALCHEAAMRAPSNASTVCLFVLRWGGWPPWVSLLLRTMEMNPTLHFLLLGDKRPRSRSWPSNVAFFKQSLAGAKKSRAQCPRCGQYKIDN